MSTATNTNRRSTSSNNSRPVGTSSTPNTSSASNHRPKAIDPEAVPFLQSHLDDAAAYPHSPYGPSNGRDDELNEMYTNQLFHASSRYKGPKVSDGFEELAVSQHPLQVIYPDKYNTTGLAYSATSKAMMETNDPINKRKQKKYFCCCFPIPERDYEPMIMYSSENPQLNTLLRYKFTHAGVWIFLGLCILVSIIVFILSPFEYQSYKNLHHKAKIGFDVCNLIVMAVSLIILILGVLTKNPQIVLVFIIIYTIDAFINLLRLYSVLQFVYFIVQLILIYVSNYYRVLISPQWYYSL